MIAYLRNEERIWEIPEGESAVGRGSDCTLPLDAGRYPEISRKHVRFTSKGGVVTFRDDNSANGTLKNGVRLSSGELHAGDTLELGAGGPMFEMWQGPVGRQDVTTKISNLSIERLVSAADRAPATARTSGQTPVPPSPAPIPAPPAPVSAQPAPIPTPPAPVPVAAAPAITAPTPVVPLAPAPLPPKPAESEGITREMPTAPVIRPVHDSATRVIPVVGARPGDPAPLGGPAAELRTVVMPRTSTGSGSGSRPQPPQERAQPAPSDHTTAVFEEDAFVPPPIAVRSTQYAMRGDDSLELALEQKLALMQKLVVAVLVVAVALVGLLLYQSREIQQNREAILALQQQASSSVSLLMPQLDQRMNRLNERLDALDPKMQKAEDHMADRMNHDLPILLDKYLATRMSTAQAMHPEAMIPH